MKRSILAVSALAVPFAALAVEMPARKPGLWEVTMPAGPGAPPIKMEMCIDAATDATLQARFGGMSRTMCARQDISRTATGFVVDAVCDFGQGPVTSRSVVSGDFQSAYTIKVEAKGPGVASSSVIGARWTGQCRADLKPGDVVMPGGARMNVSRLPGG